MSVYGYTIEYNDKVDLNTTATADINKVKASDLNEIKGVVNNNASVLQNLLGTKLWTNANPTASFSSQTITLNDAIENYNCYEIIFRQNTTSSRYMSSGKIQAGYGTILGFNTSSNYYRPTGTTITGTSLSFENANIGNSTDNAYVIPVYVIGYKQGAF